MREGGSNLGTRVRTPRLRFEVTFPRSWTYTVQERLTLLVRQNATLFEQLPPMWLERAAYF